MSTEPHTVTQEWVLKQIEGSLKPIDSNIATLLANDVQQKQWMDKLWGNGTGRKGYLENAREEDDVRYHKLFVTKNEVELEKARKEGYAAGITEKVIQEDKKQVKLDNRLLILATAAAGLVTYLLDHVKFNF